MNLMSLVQVLASTIAALGSARTASVLEEKSGQHWSHRGGEQQRTQGGAHEKSHGSEQPTLHALERVERRLFTPMAFTVCAALLGSLLFTATVVPVLATFFFKDGAKVWRNPVLVWLIDRYGRDIRCIVDHPWALRSAPSP